MLNYSKIFKQAYEITKSHKLLWILGLFLALSSSYVSFDDEQILTLSPLIKIVITAALILLVVLYFRAKAGLIAAIKTILDKEKDLSVKKALRVSRLFFSRLLGVYFISTLGLGIVGFILALPIIFLFANHYSYRGIILLIFGLLIFIPLAVIVALINFLAPLFIVLFDFKMKEAMNRSFELVTLHWPALFGLALLLTLIQLIPLFFLSFVVEFLSRANLFALIFGIIIGLSLQSVVLVFEQTAWVLVFQDLIRRQKIQEPEPLPEPEII